MGVTMWPGDFDSYDILPRWSYGGFNNFRRNLAKHAGINLDEMQGFAGGPGVPWDSIDDAIVPLLNHSDCDGELTPEQCATVGPRLLELIADMENEYDKHRGNKLADLMGRCARNNVNMVFA